MSAAAHPYREAKPRLIYLPDGAWVQPEEVAGVWYEGGSGVVKLVLRSGKKILWKPKTDSKAFAQTIVDLVNNA